MFQAQLLGRLPWFALFLRRARRLRPVLPISGLLVFGGTGTFCQEVGPVAKAVAVASSVLVRRMHGAGGRR